jgi:hypothetical protein
MKENKIWACYFIETRDLKDLCNELNQIKEILIEDICVYFSEDGINIEGYREVNSQDIKAKEERLRAEEEREKELNDAKLARLRNPEKDLLSKARKKREEFLSTQIEV